MFFKLLQVLATILFDSYVLLFYSYFYLLRAQFKIIEQIKCAYRTRNENTMRDSWG